MDFFRFVFKPDAELRNPGGHLLLGQRCAKANHLGSAGDDKILHTRHDLAGREIDRRDAATAEAVERHARDGDVVASVECRHPAEVAALLALLRRRRPDDVVDVRRDEIVAVLERPEDRGGEVLGMEVRERSLARPADAPRRANRVDDEGVRHVAAILPDPLIDIADHRIEYRSRPQRGPR